MVQVSTLIRQNLEEDVKRLQDRLAEEEAIYEKDLAKVRSLSQTALDQWVNHRMWAGESKFILQYAEKADATANQINVLIASLRHAEYLVKMFDKSVIS
jgi:hypothetical protein